jgi:Ca2+-binding EF-hand superfamily protein
MASRAQQEEESILSALAVFDENQDGMLLLCAVSVSV